MAPGSYINQCTYLKCFEWKQDHKEKYTKSPTVATQFEAAQPPSDAISSLVFAPQPSTRLLASSWDKNVYLYEVGEESASLVRSFPHRAPVLDVCFGATADEAYTAGMDWQVTRYGDATRHSGVAWTGMADIVWHTGST